MITKNTSFQTRRLPMLLSRVAMVLIVLTTVPAFALNNPFFKAPQSNSTDLKPFTKWTSVMPRYEEQKKEADANCTTDDCPNIKWEKLLVRLQGKPLATQMREVNAFFNAMPYVTDIDNWGVDDIWNTPYELMSRGGDCEDYAIAKYISLMRLGVNTANMRIMIVQDKNLGGEIHALLEVRSGDNRYILDNQAENVATEDTIFHYNPIYAINSHSWWAYQ